MTRPFKYRFIALAVVALLAACVPLGEAPIDTKFTPQSTTGIVVVGQLAQEPRNSVFGKHYDGLSLKWEDASTGVSFFSSYGGSDDPQPKMEYGVYNVPAGRYALTQITDVQPGPLLITKLIPALWGVEVRPGRIAYVGDFTINGRAFPAKIVHVGRDDAAATQALKSYPGISGELQYVGLTRIPPAAIRN